MSSFLPAESLFSREFIDKLMDFVRRATDPAPAVLKELRDIRRLLEELATNQPQVEEILNTRLPEEETWETLTIGQCRLAELLEARLPAPGMWEELVRRLPSSRRRTLSDEATGITDQLVLPIARALEVADREIAPEDEGDEQEPLATISTGVPPDTATITTIPSTDTDSASRADTFKQGTMHAKDEALANDVPWQEQFSRIEQAWLAKWSVGDLHERNHFWAITTRVCRIRPDLHDNDVLLQALDVVQQCYGDGFSYCLLDGALRQLHRPILNPLLLTTKMRRLQSRQRRWHN